MFMTMGMIGLLMFGGLALLPDFDEPITEEPPEDDDVTPEPTDYGMPPVQSSPDVVMGSFLNDMLDGNDGFNRFHGGQGDDTLNGHGGNDELIGGAGDDSVDGGQGNDTLIGEDGNDTAFGGAGNDVLRMGFGDDVSHGQDGNDTLITGHGNDVADGGAGNDALHGNDGDDTLIGGAGQDSLFGGAGSDVIDGRDGLRDYLNGGTGQDTIYADAQDIVTTGDGADVIHHTLAPDTGTRVSILDFDPTQDRIILETHTDTTPEVQITRIDDGQYSVTINETTQIIVHSDTSIDATVIEFRTL